MKEKPIIMTADSIKAILEGRKTQTRRVVKGNALKMLTTATPDVVARDMAPWNIGDRLWVKEAWAEAHNWTTDADAETPLYRVCDDKEPIKQVKWNSPMFMPRWASRITLEVTGVRFEHLRDITEEDAMKEGIISDEEYWERAGEEHLFPCPRCEGFQVHPEFGEGLGIIEVDCGLCDTAIKRFAIVWNIINGKRGYPWVSNPWVCVVDFKKLGEQSCPMRN
jgi:hypothetical protein